MESMAYLRKEKELVEMDYPLGKVWDAMVKAVSGLEWKTEESDKEAYQLKTKTKGNFMAYASVLTVKAAASGENKTQVAISAETPVTTITGVVDFGRTRERIDTFLFALFKQLQGETAASSKKEDAE